MVHKAIKILWLFGLVLLAACSSPVPDSTERLVVEPVVSPTPLDPAVLELTKPPLPAAGAPAIAVPTPVSPLATAELPLEAMAHDAWLSTSPSGAWTVHVRVAYPLADDGSLIGEEFFVNLSVFRPDGSLRWDILDEWRPFGIGYTLPSQFHWSTDEQYLFFTEHGVPDGCPTVFGFDCGLFRVDLADGSLKNLTDGSCGAARAAPDGRQFALLQNNTIMLSDLVAGFTREWEFIEVADMQNQNSWKAGGVAWSPDGSALVFTILHDICPEPGASSSILLLDLNTGEIEVLVERDSNEYFTSEWLPGDKILLFDAAKTRYWLDIKNHTITPVD